MTTRSTTLVIPDAHATPEFDNSRFSCLGEFIALRRPHNIVQIGDFLTMDSVSRFNTGVPRLREGKRIKDDLDAGADAYQRIMRPINKVNNTYSKHKKRKYVPHKIWFWGNHELWTSMYVDQHPELEGWVPEGSLLPVERDEWNVFGFRETAYIHGTAFTHVPINSGNNQPIGGKYVLRRALDLASTSVVFGHTHRFGVDCMARMSERGRQYTEAVNVGWFGDYQPAYIDGHADTLGWWAGVVLLHHTASGRFDIERISMESLKGWYSD